MQGNYSRTTARTSDVLFDVASENSSRQTCRFNNSDVAASVFARKPTLGKISASYGKGNVKSDCGDDSVFVSTGDDSMGIDYYRVAAEAYLWDFTVGARAHLHRAGRRREAGVGYFQRQLVSASTA